MPTTAVAFWAPKAGNSAEEYEDAYGLDSEEGLFAVADGASEASFAGHWARLLAENFVSRPPGLTGGGANGAAAAAADCSAELREWIKPLQEEWSHSRKGQALAWYAEQKARDGAFSTLLGLALDPRSFRWLALAIGDSCLVSVRGQKTVTAAFPLSRSEEFNNRPVLVSSLDRSNLSVWDEVKIVEGTAAKGDVFFLMTDALAQWFLVESELRRRPWAALRRLRSQEEFRAFLDLLRSGQAIRNDDATLIRIEVA